MLITTKSLINRLEMVGISKCSLFSFLYIFGLTIFVVYAQPPSGFISIDCGTVDNSSYTDDTTGISYISDTGIVDSGVPKTVHSEYITSLYDRQFWTLRSFSDGDRNCYTLRPPGGRENKYLIRARFMYGNYDALNQFPKFDLYIGVDYWNTVTLNDSATRWRYEIIHIPQRDYISVCLVNTNHGTPFISTLELRPLDMSIYETTSNESLNLYRRWDYGSTTTGVVRDKNDAYDRIWNIPEVLDGYTTLMTNSTIGSNKFALPQIVMRTAMVPVDSDSVYLSWEPINVTDQFYFYLHFAEVQLLQPNQSRKFDVYFNGKFWYNDSVFPSDYLSINSLYTVKATEANYLKYEITLNKTSTSTLPPIINAFEVYTVIDLSGTQTSDSDVDAMLSIKSTNELSKNWQGDPCGPKDYVWAGITCSNDGFNIPRITSMNLSSSQLRVITPSISNLIMLHTLDLSNNNLTGPVPDFLSQMDSLKVLNLKGNNFSSVPKQLLAKSNSGFLALSIDDFAGGNENTTQSSSRKKKESKVLVPVVASTVGVVVLMIAALTTLWFIKRRKSQEAKRVDPEINNRDKLIEGKNRQFKYSEVYEITHNFQRVIGKGGFGTVYHGFVGENQVAVKMLSPSSIQGYKEFQAEANLLISVHHKNIASLVGYCNEGTNMGIIYEYMDNGNLQQHLSDKNPNSLSWEDRLRIATDAAQGLEYLHHGCKPPIVHRDVKCTNILLNENLQAKLSDFGLSRAFSIESGTHVSTIVAGTPGYLDPHYYTTNRLSEKSDVYSFGVVMLKIITGRPAIAQDNDSVHIIQWVNSRVTIGDITNVVDPMLRGDYDVNSAWKAVEIAMACVSQTLARRPTMNYVVLELKECLAMETTRGESEVDTNANMNLDCEVAPLAR